MHYFINIKLKASAFFSKDNIISLNSGSVAIIIFLAKNKFYAIS